MGIEPMLSAWEAEVLPLNYTRVFTRRDLTTILAKNAGFFSMPNLH